MFQSDSVPLSKIYDAFMRLPSKYESLPALTTAEKDFILATIAKYRGFLIANVHRIAYLLDPVFIGVDMPQEERDAVDDAICLYPDANGSPMIPPLRGTLTFRRSFRTT